jgi:hypothetical protein
MSFNGRELRVVDLTRLDNPAVVLSVEVGDVNKTLNGREGFMANTGEGVQGRNAVSQVGRFWKQKGLIAEWGFPGDLEINPTHHLIANGVVDERGSLAASFVTGLTLYLFPSSTQMVVDLEMTLQRLEGSDVVAEYKVPVKNSWTLWQHLVFLPTSVLGSAAWGIYGADRDRAVYLYEEFRKAGAFD